MKLPKLTLAQRVSLAIYAENPRGGSYRSPRGKLLHARPETLAKLGLLVQREPTGTGWHLTELGHKVHGKDRGKPCRYCGRPVPQRPVQRFCGAKKSPLTFCQETRS
jgi:hypothetical protein